MTNDPCSTDVQIGPLEAHEDAAIDELAQSVGLRVETAAQRRLNQAHFVVARATGHEGTRVPVGFVLYWLVEDEMEIIDLGVHGAHRRRGIGSTLTRAALSEAEREGARQAFLEVRASNLPAIFLYERCGFQRWDRRRKYYSDGEDALIFRCCLARSGPADSAACSASD